MAYLFSCKKPFVLFYALRFDWVILTQLWWYHLSHMSHPIHKLISVVITITATTLCVTVLIFFIPVSLLCWILDAFHLSIAWSLQMKKSWLISWFELYITIKLMQGDKGRCRIVFNHGVYFPIIYLLANTWKYHCLYPWQLDTTAREQIVFATTITLVATTAVPSTANNIQDLQYQYDQLSIRISNMPKMVISNYF